MTPQTVVSGLDVLDGGLAMTHFLAKMAMTR